MPDDLNDGSMPDVDSLPPQPNIDLINPGSPNYNPEAYHRQMQMIAATVAAGDYANKKLELT